MPARASSGYWTYDREIDCIRDRYGCAAFSPVRMINPAFIKHDDKAAMIEWAVIALNEMCERRNPARWKPCTTDEEPCAVCREERA